MILVIDPDGGNVLEVLAEMPKQKSFRWEYRVVTDAEGSAALSQKKETARLAAYKAESDPLLAESLYDSLKSDGAVPLTASAWYAKVIEIKTRYPLAVAPAVEK